MLALELYFSLPNLLGIAHQETDNDFFVLVSLDSQGNIISTSTILKRTLKCYTLELNFETNF